MGEPVTENKTGGKLFNKYFILVWAAAFCFFMGQSVGNGTVALYCDSLGFGEGFVGSLAVSYTIFAIVARFLCGFVTDRLGRRWSLFIGCLIFAAAIYLFGVLAVPFALIILRGFHGVGFALCNTAASAANVDVTPKDKMPLGVGMLWAASAITLAVGSNIALALIEADGFGAVFLFTAAVIACGSILALFLGYEKKFGLTAKRPTGRGKLQLSDFFDKNAVPPSILILLQSMGFAMTQTFLLLYASKNGIENSGLAFTLMSACMVFSNLLSGKMAKRFGVGRCMAVSLGVFAAALVLLGLAPSPFTYFFSGAATGISCAAVPLGYSAALADVSYERRGAASSTTFLATDVGAGVGVFVWGQLLRFLDYGTVFVIVGVLQVCAIFIAIGLKRKNHLS